VGHAAGGDPVLLHRLQERGLGLRRGPVDLVGQDQVGEHRALDEPERAPTGRVILLEDLGAGDVGRHEVGRELDALERQVQGFGQGRDEQGLGQAGDPDEQAVPAREQRRQEVLDDLALADDPLVDLGAQLVVGAGDVGDRAQVGGELGLGARGFGRGRLGRGRLGRGRLGGGRRWRRRGDRGRELGQGLAHRGGLGGRLRCR
jgi:hypothetical protein